MFRNILVGDVVDGKLSTRDQIGVLFTEVEANVHAITAKVNETLGGNFILTDANCIRIIDSEGTRGMFPKGLLGRF